MRFSSKSILLSALIIIVILSFCIGSLVMFRGYRDDVARCSATIIMIKSLEHQLWIYAKNHNGVHPPTLFDLIPEEDRGFTKSFEDAWGVEFKYISYGINCLIQSSGPDMNNA